MKSSKLSLPRRWKLEVSQNRRLIDVFIWKDKKLSHRIYFSSCEVLSNGQFVNFTIDPENYCLLSFSSYFKIYFIKNLWKRPKLSLPRHWKLEVLENMRSKYILNICLLLLLLLSSPSSCGDLSDGQLVNSAIDLENGRQ